MQTYDVQDLKNELGSVLHGTALNNVQNLDQLIYRAARQLVLDVDLQETKRYTTIGPVYNGIYDYNGINDLKGNAIIDIFPMVGRVPSDWFSQIYNQDFDRNKSFVLQPNFTIKIDANTKTIRANDPTINTGIILNNCDSLTGNGIWTANGILSGLAVESTNVAQGAASLVFNASAGANPSTGYLENSTMVSSDLSNHLNQSQFFVNVYIPVTPQAITNLELRWGSSQANYWASSASVNAQGNPLTVGWNVIKFDWPTATKVGNPVVTAVNYLRCTYTTTGAQIFGLLFNGVTSQLGVIMGLEYYSKFLFMNATTKVPQETIDDDSNLIMLDTESINLLLFLVADYASQQIQGIEALFYDATYFQGKYLAAKIQYQTRYKSELQKPKTNYYRTPNNSYRRFFGRTFNRP